MKRILFNFSLAALFSILFLLITASCSSTKRALETVPTVEFERYLGKWYEIARLPNSFEKGMYCVTAVYTLKNNEKKIRVTNSGFVEAKKPKQKTSTGTAWLPNPLKPGELKVSFFRPFAGDYFIIYLDDDYQHVLVGSPDRNYLWILARTPQMNITDYNMLVNLAKQEGFKTDHLLKTKQDCKN